MISNRPEPLQNAVTEAQSRRLAGSEHSDRIDFPENPLWGYCIVNTYVLKNVLSERGLNSRVVHGGTERLLFEHDIDINDPSETPVNHIGNADHYWIEVEFEGSQYTLDLASEASNYLAEPIIEKSIPRGYLKFNDSYESAEQTIGAIEEFGDRCPYCGSYIGSENIAEGRCSECS